MKISLFLLTAPLALTLSACGGGDDTNVMTDDDGNTIEVTNNADGDEDKVDVTLSSDEGKVSVQAGDSVDQDTKLPMGLPIMPGAKLTMNMQSSQKTGETGGMFALETEASVDAVAAFYKKALTDAGFTIDAEMAMDSAKTMNAKRGEKESVMISTQPGTDDAEGKTAVTIIVGVN